ncbi:DUF4129 domain-containing protein [Bailinhaonella thermotolerans]|uniref:DUF4129 domain-containing protein n=1 Tax=Bailinhaonella thermotolerans TaxID=1070861 RepID=A0A3A4BGM6_9ACTN|nr:DUF4129 domain-containing protein [Bailinhaonella thermotolerans]RJL30462.1 DUF4129 domain-containing protein [Bailinhaonella thermotolerans]
MIPHDPIDIGAEQAREAARRELSGPAYEHESWSDLVLRWIDDFLSNVFTEGEGGVPGGLIAGIVLVLVLVAVVALILWRAGRVSRSAASPPDSLYGETAMSAAQHRAESERLAAAGQWADAVRERFRAMARDLEERALVSPLPGRTADELADEAARALPGFRDELAAGARLFDEIVYGGRPGAPPAYERLRDLDERVRTARPALMGGGS